MAPELAELRKALLAIPFRGGRRRYPEALKARVVAYHQARRAAGALCREVASELGLNKSQLSEWSRLPEAAGFKAVQLLDDTDRCREPATEAVTGLMAEVLDSKRGVGATRWRQGRTRDSRGSPPDHQVPQGKGALSAAESPEIHHF